MLAELIKNAKEKPDAYPIMCDRHPDPYHPNPLNMVRNRTTCRVYEFLRNNPEKAFTAPEVASALKERVQVTILKNLSNKNFIFKSKFMIPTGRTFNSMGFLFSFSEKAIWKRVVDTIPKSVKQALFMILKNPNMIFSIKDLHDLCGMEYSDKYTWFDKIFIRSFEEVFQSHFLERRVIRGLRTFYYSPQMTEEKFQEVYRRYYQKNILSQESLSKLKGQYFEDFSTWTFIEYMKLKGLKLELKKVDREPCDFIANIKINIGDLLVKDPEKEINVAQFVISCKNWNLDRCVSGNYVLGMSGALSRGLSFNNEQIFTPCRSIGVIICTKANYRAWKMAASQGILIIDLWKLMRMYNVVKEATGQTHPYYENISMKVEAFENKKKGI